MNQRLIRILGGATERYPHALESNFPRILNNIMSLWDDEGMDDYFMSLMVSDRPHRNGFPPEVAAEILHLSLVHAAAELPEKPKGIWDAPKNSFASFASHPAENLSTTAIAIKSELGKVNLSYTTEGFLTAAETGNCAALALFLEAKNSPEIRDNRGWTPLMIAAFNGMDEAVALLIRHGADVNALDLGGNSALHWAAFSGHLSCAKQLIDNHALINIRNNFGWSPLFQATTRNRPDVVSLLIASGANLDSAADDGYTALHKAAASGYSEIVQLLLAHGTDKSLTTHDNNTAQTLAAKNKHDDIANMLMN
ncbi:MAG: ankyrin repeat domain-containing protein [Gallionella sp.]|nr:ankyrin repeat domain-containing protein [Gallionella sp.]